MKTPKQMIEHIENSRSFFNNTVDYPQQRDFNMRCRNILKYNKVDDVYLYFIKKFIIDDNPKENAQILLTAFDKVISNEKLEELLRESGDNILTKLGIPNHLR